MSLLDNRSLIKQVDRENYFNHVLDAPEQLTDGFELGSSLPIPALYAQAKHVVLLAVGEMLPVAEVLVSLMVPYARIPVVIVNDYVLPKWVSRDTLVIAIDYSGATEQVLAAYREAAQQRARLVSVAIESDLAREARRFRAPHITLSYGAPPRAAFYYMLGCLVALCRKLDLVDIRESTVTESSVLARSLLQSVGIDVAQYQNSAKQLAEKMINRQVLIIGSGSLVGVVKKWQVNLATTSKLIAASSSLGDFNDTMINGLRTQTKLTDAPLVIMLQSKYDHPRNKLQQTLTYQVAQAKKFLYEQIFMHPSGSALGEVVLSSLLGDMVGYYVCLLTNRDPSHIEATAYIRERLMSQRDES